MQIIANVKNTEETELNITTTLEINVSGDKLIQLLELIKLEEIILTIDNISSTLIFDNNSIKIISKK